MEENPPESAKHVHVRTRNSLYEVDRENKRVRRLTSNHDPTPRQGPDGEWTSFEEVVGLQPGVSMVIIWSQEDAVPKTTRTSTIQSVQRVSSTDE